MSSGTSFETSTSSDSAPRLADLRSVRTNHFVECFDCLTVPGSALPQWQSRQGGNGPSPAVQFMVEYLPSTSVDGFEPNMLRALCLVEKILRRGTVTTLSPWLESHLRLRPENDHVFAAAYSSLTPMGSPAEDAFWTEQLPAAVGPDFARWVVSQPPFSTLLVAEDGAERADYLLHHPRLPNPLVIEVDGKEYHDDRTEEDLSRDRRLREQGYDTLRIPASEIFGPSGPQIEAFFSLTEPIRTASITERVFRSPPRRAGQVHLALLTALRRGVVPVEGRIRVGTDLVVAGELLEEEEAAIIADFAALFADCCTLYGAECPDIVTTGPMTSRRGKNSQFLRLAFYDHPDGSEVMHVRDLHLPFRIAWQPMRSEPGLPAFCDEALATRFLERVFRYREFQKGQFPALSRALAGLDTIVLLPTGAGKSLIYQLAALLLPGRGVVVQPIVALIRDQVENLRRRGIDRALGITGDMGDAEARGRAYQSVKAGDQLLYFVAPERFQIREFRDAVASLASTGSVNLIAIDEAHCVSEWGHDFRTSYLRVGDTSRATATSGEWTPVLLGLTGTASRVVLRDVQHELGITDPDGVLTPESFDRSELKFEVVRCPTVAKRSELRRLLTQVLPESFKTTPEDFRDREGSDAFFGLVFCPHVNGRFGVASVYQFLESELRWNCDFYSGKKPDDLEMSGEKWSDRKRAVERSFKDDVTKVLACTKAFGMGVDKPNIRFTIHYGMPSSIESFYQEAGRAGRNRKDSFCCLLLSNDHPELNRGLLQRNTELGEVGQELEGQGYRKDDVSRCLYFHTNSFKGVDAELRQVRALLRELRNPAEPGEDRVEYRAAEQTIREKAVHRLVILGVVADYETNYSSRFFHLTLSGIRRQEIIDRFVDYVAASQPGRETKQRELAAALLDVADWREFVLGVANLLIAFVYDVVEKQRRIAMGEMLRAAEAGSSDSFRVRILRYLESTEYSVLLEEISLDAEGGMEKMAALADLVRTPDEAERLRGEAARYLESYPTQPTLLLARSLAEVLCLDVDWRTAEDALVAAVRSAADDYGLGIELVADAAAAMLRSVHDADPMAATRLEAIMLREYPSPEFARQLVAEATLDVCALAPWLVLTGVLDPMATQS